MVKNNNIILAVILIVALLMIPNILKEEQQDGLTIRGYDKDGHIIFQGKDTFSILEGTPNVVSIDFVVTASNTGDILLTDLQIESFTADGKTVIGAWDAWDYFPMVPPPSCLGSISSTLVASSCNNFMFNEKTGGRINNKIMSPMDSEFFWNIGGLRWITNIQENGGQCNVFYKPLTPSCESQYRETGTVGPNEKWTYVTLTSLATTDTNKQIWVSPQTSLQQFEGETQPVTFYIKVRGTDVYNKVIIFDEDFKDLTIEPDIINFRSSVLEYVYDGAGAEIAFSSVCGQDLTRYTLSSSTSTSTGTNCNAWLDNEFMIPTDGREYLFGERSGEYYVCWQNGGQRKSRRASVGGSSIGVGYVSTDIEKEVPCAVQSCSCSGWIDDACNVGGCTETQMRQIRTCTPSGCLIESQCVGDFSCTASPVCGNNIIEGAEVCESGPDLLFETSDDNIGSETCASVWGVGYTGTLMCADGTNCLEFLDSGCSPPAGGFVSFRTTDLDYGSGGIAFTTSSCGTDLTKVFGYESTPSHTSYECENHASFNNPGSLILSGLPNNGPLGSGSTLSTTNFGLYQDDGDSNEVWVCVNDVDGNGAWTKRYDGDKCNAGGQVGQCGAEICSALSCSATEGVAPGLEVSC